VAMNDAVAKMLSPTLGTVEWERKWDGVKSEPVVLDTENVFEALKAVSTHADCAQYTANDK
jgi:hypothetical protein